MKTIQVIREYILSLKPKARQKSIILPLLKECPDIPLNDFPFEDIVYYIINNLKIEKHYCKICGKEVHVKRGQLPDICSRSCSTKYNAHKAKETNLKKYGVEYSTQCKEIKDKIKQSNKKNNGGQGFASKSIKDKYNATIKEKYNVNSISESPAVKEKISKALTGKKKSYTTHKTVPETYNKIQDTIQKKYNTKHYFNTQEFKVKTRKTLQTKYGVSNVMQDKQIAKKCQEQQLDKSYNKLLENKDITPLFTREEWHGHGCKSSNKIYEWQCRKCGKVFQSVINGPTNMPVCRDCYPYYISKGERELLSFIQQLLPNETIITNDRQLISPKEVDIYIPSLNIAFEYNGNFYHSRQNNRPDDSHYNKTIACLSQFVILYHIFEYEWQERKEYMKDKIKAILNKQKDIDSQYFIVNESFPILPPKHFSIVLSCQPIEIYTVQNKLEIADCGKTIYKDPTYIKKSDKFKTQVSALLRDISNVLEDVYFSDDKLQLDYYMPDYKLAIKLIRKTDRLTKQQVFNDWKSSKYKNIRVINIYEAEFEIPQKYNVIRNMIQFATGQCKKIYARNTKVAIIPAIEMKSFINRCNIQGYRNADTAFVLLDKQTEQPLMCYTVGKAFLGKGNYDVEIARGCCEIDYNSTGTGVQVIGGASKLWKAILNFYSNIQTIVYYTDNRYYSGNSISRLMSGSNDGTVSTIAVQPGLMNYFVKEDKLKNRDPAHHKSIKEKIANGEVIEVHTPGTSVHLFKRK